METTNGHSFQTAFSLKPFFDRLKESENLENAQMPPWKEDVLDLLELAPELLAPTRDLSILDSHKELMEQVMSLIFPRALAENTVAGAFVPFSLEPVFVTPRFEEFFLNPDGSFKARSNISGDRYDKIKMMRAYLLMLNRLYGIDADLGYPQIYTATEPETGLERYFEIKFDFRFVEVNALAPLKELSEKDRPLVREHLHRPEVLKGIFPPENFRFEGFAIFHAVDVTEREILLSLEKDLIDKESIFSKDGFLLLQQRLRTLFRKPDIVATLTAIMDDQAFLLNTGCDMAAKCIFSDSQHLPISEFTGTVFERAAKEKKIMRVQDLTQTAYFQKIKGDIQHHNTRSLMIAPLVFKGECIGLLDLGSPEIGGLNPMDAVIMSNIQPLFSIAIKRALEDLEHRIQSLIKEKCTAIHPSVEWRFQKAALNHFETRQEGRIREMESIIFKDVYPLYGASDIRGSTNERNLATQKDLTEHLDMALNVIRLAEQHKPLLFLKELAGRIDRQRNRILSGIETGDHLSVVQFLTTEVESIFSHMTSFGEPVARAIEEYKAAVDSGVGAVYRLRKKFEESVSILNDTLANYLDREEADVQELFPHYFERRRTDGVDYLIYIGESLVEDREFHEIYLKNLRLWQLKVACGLAWHTKQLKPFFSTPLETAHLILVQSMPLSLRFRFDEKRFGVEGAYDTQHEIIKSRIDKATVRGSGERLTQPEKIAIVYTQPQEATEMRRHIDFLTSETYLTGEPELLELSDLPGVQGLRAIRVNINLESEKLAEKAEQMID